MTVATAPAPRGKGVIHDLGYARYAGERRPAGTLWRVIMRQQLSYAWKTLWRYKPWVMIAVIITVIVGALMSLRTNSTIQAIEHAGGRVRFIDAALPMSYEFYRMVGFMVTMTIGATVIARDQESGAFTFYFSRPVRPIDYVLGKLAGMLALMAVIFLAGPLLLGLLSVGIAGTANESRSLDAMLDELVILPKVIAVGSLATMLYAALPLAISSLAGRRTVALGLWAAYYIVGIKLVANLGALTWKPLMAIDPGNAMDVVAMRLFDLTVTGEREHVPVWAGVASLLLQTAGAVWVLITQVTKHAEGSVGGSS